MRFVIDAQLPPGLAVRLRKLGFVTEHVNRIGLGAASDIAIWEYAKQCGAILITKDEDFVAHAKSEEAGPQVVWIRLGNIGNDALWAVMSTAFDEIHAALAAGERIIEVT